MFNGFPSHFTAVLCIPKTCDTPSPPQIPKEYKNTFLNPIKMTAFLSALWISVKVALALLCTDGYLPDLLTPEPEQFRC